MRQIDKAGNERWKNTKDFGGGSIPSFYKNKVYACAKYIYTIDPNTGATVKAFQPFPNDNTGGFADVVAFNPEKDYGYVSDGRYLYCFRIK